MIILEGPDCAGKTTLAKIAFNDWSYRHQGPYSRDPLVQTITALQRGVNETVWDRLHIGEQVYGPIYRDRDTLGDVGRRMVERYILGRQGVVIFALPDVEMVVQSFRERLGDEMFRHDDWEANVRKQHAKFSLAGTWLPWLAWNYATDDPREIKEQALRLRPPYNAGPGVGDFTSDGILIIGEQPNPKQQGEFAEMALPFISRQGCSPWLAEKMDEGHIPERGMYWVNARDRKGRVTDPDFLERLKPKHVVALGTEAKMWAQMQGLTPEYFVHPSCWMRFHYQKPYPLIDRLKELTHAGS